MINNLLISNCDSNTITNMNVISLLLIILTSLYFTKHILDGQYIPVLLISLWVIIIMYYQFRLIKKLKHQYLLLTRPTLKPFNDDFTI